MDNIEFNLVSGNGYTPNVALKSLERNILKQIENPGEIDLSLMSYIVKSKFNEVISLSNRSFVDALNKLELDELNNEFQYVAMFLCGVPYKSKALKSSYY